eukprot:evm.model.NODE_8941_length_7211_cov_36.003605.2
MASAGDLSVRQFFSKSKIDGQRATNISNSNSKEQQQQQEREQRQQEEEQQQQHRRRRLCKAFVETDRGLRAEEAGYLTQLMLLTPRECTPKNDLLCGYPGEWEEMILERGNGEGREAVEEMENVVVNCDDAVVFDAFFGDSGAGGEGEGENDASDEDEEG